SNNMLQLGLALGNYVSTHQVLPPGVVNDQGPILNVPQGYHHGWAVQILPFVEQKNVYRHFRGEYGVYDQTNMTAREISIATFLCPCGEHWGRMSHAGSHNDVEAPIDVDNHGALYLNSHVRHDDNPDGMAYTILLGEMRRDSATLGWAS